MSEFNNENKKWPWKKIVLPLAFVLGFFIGYQFKLDFLIGEPTLVDMSVESSDGIEYLQKQN